MTTATRCLTKCLVKLILKQIAKRSIEADHDPHGKYRRGQGAPFGAHPPRRGRRGRGHRPRRAARRALGPGRAREGESHHCGAARRARHMAQNLDRRDSGVEESLPPLMSFVLDASIAAAWYLADENSSIAEMALERLESEPATAPTLFWYEIRNLMITQERRGRIGAAHIAAALTRISAMQIRFELPDSELVLALARTHHLTVYDASYLSLAQ